MTKEIFGMLIMEHDVKSGDNDFAFMAHDDALALAQENTREFKTDLLRSGDLIKVFNTVSKGEIYWSGTIDMEYDRNQTPYGENLEFSQQMIHDQWVHGAQADMEPEAWSAMFHANLAAKLEKQDGTVIYGSLHPFCETGTEGILWSVSEFSKAGYKGSHRLNDGDNLTVYSKVLDGNVAFEGRLDFEDKPQTFYSPFIFKRTALHEGTGTWAERSYANCPAVLMPQ